MATDSSQQGESRPLLGLRPPAELAVGPEIAPKADPAAEMPARPGYTRISSGWDSEDQESRGKTSDLATALRAAAVLVAIVVVVAFLVR